MLDIHKLYPFSGQLTYFSKKSLRYPNAAWAMSLGKKIFETSLIKKGEEQKEKVAKYGDENALKNCLFSH